MARMLKRHIVRKLLSIALMDIYYCDKDGEAATNKLCVVVMRKMLTQYTN